MSQVAVRTSGNGDTRIVLIPEGPELCRISAITLKRGKDSGEPYLEFQLRPIDEEWNGRLIFHNFTLDMGEMPDGTPVRWAFIQFLESMGYDDDLETLETDELLERHVIVHVVHESWGGRIRNKAGSVEATEKTTELDREEGLVNYADVDQETGEVKSKELVTA